MLTKTNLYSLCAILALLALVLTACAAPGGVINPTPTAEPDQPVSSDTPAPSPVEPTEPSGNVILGVAAVETVEIRILESFPVQIHVVARGNLPDGCTTIDHVAQVRNGDTFEVRITTSRPAGAICTMALVPFEEVVPLEVAGLPAGTYTVDVNRGRESFTLDVDNTLPTDEYGDPEYL